MSTLPSPLKRRRSTSAARFAVLLLLGTGSALADSENQGSDTGVKGINPADNLTKFEVLPKYAVVNDSAGVSITTLTFKYDRALKGARGFNVELPTGYFDSPDSSEYGLGDLNLRFRQQIRGERWTYVVGTEVVLPTATSSSLGSGKVQWNWSAAAVYAVSKQTFLAAAGKQLFSVAGASSRPDIVQGQYRLIAAHSTTSGWWFLADPQLWVDYNRDARTQFSLEVEVGHMIAPMTGVWLRGGGRLGGNWHKDDWAISGGIRFISF
ncbi:hypothetical protein [Nibricoccus sp. IMCC34717]|uniref:hypothetical protein n=1 Tax=Nibricoccus sp. IMCC34717 TaxID=3034021 RepID=UPI00384ECAD3